MCTVNYRLTEALAPRGSASTSVQAAAAAEDDMTYDAGQLSPGPDSPDNSDGSDDLSTSTEEDSTDEDSTAAVALTQPDSSEDQDGDEEPST